MGPELKRLLRALFVELERMEWTEFDDDMPNEVDDWMDSGHHDHDYHDEVEFCEDCFDDGTPPRWPMCVECGNLSPSCVC
jgi:hypothetical protein